MDTDNAASPEAPPAVKVSKSLIAALVVAQAIAERVAKEARNQHHNYVYASAEAVIDEAGNALQAAGLAAVPILIERAPDQVNHVWMPDGQDLDIPRRLRMVLRLFHGESGDHMDIISSIPVIPDKGRPEDKAELGARTELLAYALRDLLLLPRMNDNTPSERGDNGYQPRGGAKGPPTPSPAPKPASAPQVTKSGGGLAKPNATAQGELPVPKGLPLASATAAPATASQVPTTGAPGVAAGTPSISAGKTAGAEASVGSTPPESTSASQPTAPNTSAAADGDEKPGDPAAEQKIRVAKLKADIRAFSKDVLKWAGVQTLALMSKLFAKGKLDELSERELSAFLELLQGCEVSDDEYLSRLERLKRQKPPLIVGSAA